MICAQGDIIVVSFDTSRGHEPQKTRPALVVSTDGFNLMSSLTMVAPITSRNNRYPLHVPITDEGCGAQGCVCVEQMRALDLNNRRCHKLGSLSEDDMAEVLSVVGAVFGI